MQIIIVGLNHKTAPVEVRERLAFSGDLLGRALEDLKSCRGVDEGLILSTCNRVEVCAVTRNTEDGFKSIQQYLESIHRGQPEGVLSSHFYFYETREAIRHIFRVASSLDSMVIGEPQILAQVKAAFEEAMGRSTTGVVLNKLFKKAISVGKRVRTETGISENPISVSAVAVELSSRIFSHFDQTSILLVGSGEMAEASARHLAGRGVRRIRIMGRNQERAGELAREFEGQSVAFDRLDQELIDSDIVIASTSAAHHLITKEQMRQIIHARKNRPIFLIDLSVPRNVDPAVNVIDNVYLYNIDDLSQVVESNMQQRQQEAARAERIVEEEIQTITQWLKSLDVVPTIVAIRNQAEDIRRLETQRALNRMGDVPEEVRQNLEGLTQSIVNKLLHAPLMVLKREANASDGILYVEAIRRLFNLDAEVPMRYRREERKKGKPDPGPSEPDQGE